MFQPNPALKRAANIRAAFEKAEWRTGRQIAKVKLLIREPHSKMFKRILDEAITVLCRTNPCVILGYAIPRNN
jgi:predicted 2-oxoglutarate/Fe(II)-dependent dioxygenase YbiX